MADDTIRITLEIRSVIHDLDDGGLTVGEPEIQRFTSVGKMQIKGNATRLSYTEKGEGGVTDSTVTVLPEDHVTVARHGAVETLLSFFPGGNVKTEYAVPPFRFEAEVKTEKIRITKTEAGGEISLLYRLTVGGAPKLCKLLVTYKTKSL